tara:strand:- start:213 stop:659 length:447 start_codon:yes stop_codon:yes gene_type:complete
MPIKSFRGKLADGAIQTIALATNNGSTGYRIVKFDLFPVTPNENQESLVSIFKVSQTAAATTTDFADNTLLGAGLYLSKESTLDQHLEIVFDNEIFNQDIYITHTEGEATRECNYYIELEQMNLALDENTTATLKDIKNIEGHNLILE